MIIFFSVLLSSAFGAINLPADVVVSCDGQLRYSGVYALGDPRAQILDDLLERRPLNPAVLIEFMVRHPLLGPLNLARAFAGTAGVSENYSLREHTRMVLDVYRTQELFYDLSPELKKLVVVALIFHDVGKPAAVVEFTEARGHAPATRDEFRAASGRQYHWTMLLLPKISELLGFTESEGRLIGALVRDDLVGEVIVRKKDPVAGAMSFRGVAQFVGRPVAEIFAAKTLMYVADAGSYPGLRYGRELGDRPKPPVFVEDFDGRLTPISPEFHELTSLLQK